MKFGQTICEGVNTVVLFDLKVKKDVSLTSDKGTFVLLVSFDRFSF